MVNLPSNQGLPCVSSISKQASRWYTYPPTRVYLLCYQYQSKPQDGIYLPSNQGLPFVLSISKQASRWYIPTLQPGSTFCVINIKASLKMVYTYPPTRVYLLCYQYQSKPQDGKPTLQPGSTFCVINIKASLKMVNLPSNQGLPFVPSISNKLTRVRLSGWKTVIYSMLVI